MYNPQLSYRSVMNYYLYCLCRLAADQAQEPPPHPPSGLPQPPPNYSPLNPPQGGLPANSQGRLETNIQQGPVAPTVLHGRRPGGRGADRGRADRGRAGPGRGRGGRSVDYPDTNQSNKRPRLAAPGVPEPQKLAPALHGGQVN